VAALLGAPAVSCVHRAPGLEAGPLAGCRLFLALFSGGFFLVRLGFHGRLHGRLDFARLGRLGGLGLGRRLGGFLGLAAGGFPLLLGLEFGFLDGAQLGGALGFRLPGLALGVAQDGGDDPGRDRLGGLASATTSASTVSSGAGAASS
jgi:hypothetical protein